MTVLDTHPYIICAFEEETAYYTSHLEIFRTHSIIQSSQICNSDTKIDNIAPGSNLSSHAEVTRHIYRR